MLWKPPCWRKTHLLYSSIRRWAVSWTEHSAGSPTRRYKGWGNPTPLPRRVWTAGERGWQMLMFLAVEKPNHFFPSVCVMCRWVGSDSWGRHAWATSTVSCPPHPARLLPTLAYGLQRAPDYSPGSLLSRVAYWAFRFILKNTFQKASKRRRQRVGASTRGWTSDTWKEVTNDVTLTWCGPSLWTLHPRAIVPGTAVFQNKVGST